MTTSLSDLQKKFQNRLLHGDDAVDPLLGNGGPFMKVYDHAYRARLIEVMSQDFEGLHTLLGDAQFADVVTAYVNAHPPRQRSIRWLGKDLAAWLAETPAWAEQPMIADMAAFEWMLGLSFDAPDETPLQASAMAKVPPEAWPMLTFTFHPSLNTALLSHDVAPFQRAAVSEDEKPDSAPAPFAEPITWAAWRDPNTMIVTHRALDIDEAAMLHAAAKGETFDAMCEVVADLSDTDDAAVRAASILRAWLDCGWVVGLDGEGISW